MSNQLSPLMAMAQSGLYVEPGSSAHYLECRWPEIMPWERVKQALQEALQPRANVHIAVGFGAKAWPRTEPSFAPKLLFPFASMAGSNGHSMPSTQSDIWFWVHGEDRGDVVEAVLQIEQAIYNVLDIVLDKSGFKNRESRDLTGFVDGTANPKEDKRGDAAQIPLGEVGEGGSYVFTQLWRHNLREFNKLSIPEQEDVFGRTKVDNIEMRGDDMPKTSHVSRTDVKVDGVGQKIYRRSTPYGGATEHGLYFLAFACNPARIEIQLARMLGNTEDGLSDKMMEYTEAVTGAYWFMPAQKDLDALLG